MLFVGSTVTKNSVSTRCTLAHALVLPYCVRTLAMPFSWSNAGPLTDCRCNTSMRPRSQRWPSSKHCTRAPFVRERRCTCLERHAQVSGSKQSAVRFTLWRLFPSASPEIAVSAMRPARTTARPAMIRCRAQGCALHGAAVSSLRPRQSAQLLLCGIGLQHIYIVRTRIGVRLPGLRC